MNLFNVLKTGGNPFHDPKGRFANKPGITGTHMDGTRAHQALGHNETSSTRVFRNAEDTAKSMAKGNTQMTWHGEFSSFEFDVQRRLAKIMTAEQMTMLGHAGGDDIRDRLRRVWDAMPFDAKKEDVDMSLILKEVSPVIDGSHTIGPKLRRAATKAGVIPRTVHQFRVPSSQSLAAKNVMHAALLASGFQKEGADVQDRMGHTMSAYKQPGETGVRAELYHRPGQLGHTIKIQMYNPKPPAAKPTL